MDEAEFVNLCRSDQARWAAHEADEEAAYEASWEAKARAEQCGEGRHCIDREEVCSIDRRLGDHPRCCDCGALLSYGEWT